MLFPDSDESQHIWLQRIQLHAYSLACRSQQGTKSCWILSGAAVFTPCRERERRQYLPEDGSHNLQEGSQQHLADSADTSLYVTHLEIIYRVGPHALQTWGGVSRKMLRKNSLQGKLVLVTLWASGMCWQVEEVCNCWRSPNPVSSKNIGLSQADPSDHPRVRFVTVWTAGVVFGHPTHPAGIANGRFIKGLRSAHCDWVQTLENYFF